MKLLTSTLILVSICLGLSKNTSAQIPGYAGKRIGLSYNLNVGLVGVIFKSTNLFKVSAKPKHTFQADLVIGRKWSFSPYFSYTRINRGTKSIAGIEQIDRVNTVFSSREYFSQIKTLDLNVLQFGAAFKYFVNGTIAPLGKYVRFSMGSSKIINNSPEYTAECFLCNSIEGNIRTFKNSESQNIITAGIGIGKTTIIKKSVFLDFGADLHYGLSRQALSSTTFDIIVRRYWNASELFYFHIGIGIFL